MEKLITVSTRGRRWRRWVVLLLSCLYIVAAYADSPLRGAWRAAEPGDTAQSVLRDFHRGTLESFDPTALQRFPQSPRGVWVVITPQPPSDNGERVLTLYPPPLTQVQVYTQGQVHTLALDDFSEALHGDGRLAWTVPAGSQTSAPILLKIDTPSPLNAPLSFQLQSMASYRQQDAHWLVFASASFAVMLAMALMALCFAVMLCDITYAWYAGYICCYALIQSIQTGFAFHPLEWQWLAHSDVLVAAAAVALSVTFAALFMARFCRLQRYAPIFRVPVMALALGMLLILLMRCSHVALLVELSQVLLNPVLILGATLLLVAAVVAAIRGSRPAWFFLAGWTPLLLLTAMTSAQLNGALADASWLNDASLGGGAIESLLLSLGLADRALSIRHDRDSARQLADHDALTSVFNRRAWSERASALLSSGEPRPIALLFMDLDHFKLLNDHQGHATGDRALAEVAKALQSELRPTDLLCRYGGEEFVAMLDGIGRDEAMQVATRLCRRVHRLEIPTSDESKLLTVSIGVALRRDGDDVGALAERADQAMYAAKLEGRNRVLLYSVAHRSQAMKARLHKVEDGGGTT